MIVNPGIRRFVGGVNGILRSLFFYAPRTSSITQTRGAGTPTETRATVATVMGYAADATLADGQTLLTVASGELRFQGARRVSEGVWSNVDADGAPIPAATLKGAVVEAAATNLALRSNAFTTAWTKTQAGDTVTQNATGVSGATDAWTCIPDGTSGLHGLIAGGGKPLSSLTYTASIYAKAAGYNFLTFRIDAAGGNGVYCVFNLALGTVVTAATAVGAGWTAGTATIELLRNGLYRCSCSFTTASESTWRFIPLVMNAAGNPFTPYNFSGDTVSGIVMTAAQVELGSFATSYIPTTTAAVPRDADVPDDQVASNLTAAAGSVAFTWTPSHDPSGTIALCGSYVDASNYTALLHDGTKYIWRKRIAGVNYDAELTAAYANGTSAKIVLTLGASGINLAVDGVLGTAHANTDDAQLGTRWQWGSDGNGGQQAGAAFKEMYLTPRTMSDAELQAITV